MQCCRGLFVLKGYILIPSKRYLNENDEINVRVELFFHINNSF